MPARLPTARSGEGEWGVRLLFILNTGFLTAFAVTMALMVLLNQQKFSDILHGLDDSRVSVVTLDTTRRLRQAVDLGLPLKDVAESRAMVEALVSEHPELESVSVFDARGRLVAHGGEEAGGGPGVPDRWMAANSGAAGEVWRLEDGGSFVVGGPVVNNFGKLEGGVAVRYGKDRFNAVVASLTFELIEAAAVIFAVSGVVAVLGTAAALWRLTGAAREMRRRVEGLLKSGETGPGAGSPEHEDIAGFAGYSAAVRKTDEALAAAEGRDR